MPPIRWMSVLLAMAACSAHGPDRLTLNPVALRTLPGWSAEHPADILPALLRNCAQLARMPQDQKLGGEGEAARLGGTPAQWAPACAEARKLPPGRDRTARLFFERRFQAYAVSNNYRPAPLFTGYYEPEVLGDLAPDRFCATPLLGTPADLIQTILPAKSIGAADPGARRVFGRLVGGAVKPYFDRMAIENGVLDDQGLARFWLQDPIDLFFLQIQGSGRVILPDGTMRRVGYAAQNGRPYVDIGRMLAARGELAGIPLTMQAVRDWLRQHPVERRAVMDANPSYVFFREVSLRPDEGPLGAIGLPLTPRRSAAVDTRFMPLGALLWVDTRDPTDNTPLQRLMLAQDVGGAIRGPARADLFFGWGDEAERRAGGMWGRGGEYVLLPRANDLAQSESVAAR